ncbi:MAG: bacillithiol biosynthesis BshC, partial [Myxococcota bacterium]
MTDRFAHAYLAHDPRTTTFVPHRFDSAADRAAAVSMAAKRSVSSEVQAFLRDFNRRLPPSPAREAHIEALAEPGTVCVVTGQQVGLYLGPLYTLYKAAAAIVNAQELQNET